MTKKFWYNWQKRANQTDVIWLFVKRSDGTPYHMYATYIDGKVQSIKFDGDTVTVTTKISFPTWNPITGSHWTTENRKHVLNRNDIKTVYFM